MAGGENCVMATTAKIATRVHRVLEQSKDNAIVFPGVYDTLSARIVQRVGFPMSFISGYSVAAAGIGEPDLGLLTQTEIVERARTEAESALKTVKVCTSN